MGQLWKFTKRPAIGSSSLKIDALLEAAVRFIVKANFTGRPPIDDGIVEEFVDSLPIVGGRLCWSFSRQSDAARMSWR